jgi:hypothetical protein
MCFARLGIGNREGTLPCEETVVNEISWLDGIDAVRSDISTYLLFPDEESLPIPPNAK